MSNLTKKIFLLFVIAFVATETAVIAATIDKTSIAVYARRRTGSYEEIEKRGYAIWGWTPQVDLRINGPISGGGQIILEFLKPGGKPWLKSNCETGEIAADQWWDVRNCGQDLAEELLAREVGLYEMKVHLNDELAGSKALLFSGKLNVNKFFAGGVEPRSEQHFGYYVDYDWYLPIGQVYAKEPTDNNNGYEDEYAPFAVTLWFRGDVQNEVSAHLFYKGREISNTKDTSKGTWLGEKTISTFDTSKFNWKKHQFIFTNTLVFNREDPDNHPDSFRMDKNPGEYEVKVLRRGALVRSLKFTIGSDGKLVDTGIAAKNSLGNRRIIVPVMVTGEEDGAGWNKDAWRTGAFFANPLTGFTL